MTIQSKKNSNNWIFWLIIFSIFCMLVYTLRSVLLPFVLGIVIGYLLNPFADRFEKLGINRTLATCIVLLISVILIIPVFAVLIGMINEQLSSFLGFIPQYVTSVVKKAEPLLLSLQERFPSLEAEKIKAYTYDNLIYALKFASQLVKKLVSGGFAFINLLSLLLITPIVAFYMLRDWNKFIAKVDGLLPKKTGKTIRQQMQQIDTLIASFIRGQLSVCILLGLFYAIGLYLIKVELGVVIGFVSGLISFIPYFGSIFGFLLSASIAAVQFSSFTPVLYVVAVFAIGQFIEGNFLTPKLVGDSVGLHPIWIMFALLSGGVLLGFLGLMIAVPTAAVIGVFAQYAIKNYRKSNLYLEK